MYTQYLWYKVYKGGLSGNSTLPIAHFRSSTLRMARYLALIVLWTTFLNISLELEMNENEMKAMKGKFCGTHLADMLSLVCDGVYNNKQKKSMSSNKLSHDDYEDAESLEYLDDPLLSFPFRSRQHAKSIIPVELRKRSRGVVDECCHSPCSLWEMTGYCGKQ